MLADVARVQPDADRQLIGGPFLPVSKKPCHLFARLVCRVLRPAMTSWAIASGELIQHCRIYVPVRSDSLSRKAAFPHQPIETASVDAKATGGIR